jgi:hypothetical protein
LFSWLQATLSGLLTAVLDQVDLIRIAPLPERSFGRLRFEYIPLFETAFRCEKLLESRVSAAAPEEGLDIRVPVRQPLFNKPECEIGPKVEVILMRYRDVRSDVSRSAGSSSSSIGFVSEIQ